MVLTDGWQRGPALVSKLRFLLPFVSFGLFFFFLVKLCP